MTKAVSNRKIYFVKAVLLLCKHGHFFEKKIENSVFFLSMGLLFQEVAELVNQYDYMLGNLLQNIDNLQAAPR